MITQDEIIKVLHDSSELVLIDRKKLANFAERIKAEGIAPPEGYVLWPTRKHKFWGAGEADCPKDIKGSNGELHTFRCKFCGTSDQLQPCITKPFDYPR